MSYNRSAADIAAEAMEGLDDQLQPTDDKAVVVEDHANVDEEEKGDKASGALEEDNAASGSDASADDEGYTIDEAEGDESDPAEEEKKPEPEAKQVDPNDLSPELKYIVDNLKPLKVRGTTADSDEVREYEVYDPSQLPDGFRYTDDKSRDIANKSFFSMETRAQQLVNDFRSQESQKAAKAFKESEERADWSDIASLQKAGDLPKFRLKPTDPKFDEDPASQLIEKVLDFKDKVNEKYLEESNAGAPYRHIGFEDAYRRYVRENPQQGRSDEEKKEDEDRKDLSRRTRGGQSDSGKATSKAPSLRNKQDIDSFIDSLEW